MNRQLPWGWVRAATRRRARIARVYVDADLSAVVHFSGHGTIELVGTIPVSVDIRKQIPVEGPPLSQEKAREILERVDSELYRIEELGAAVPWSRVPVFCEWLLCLVVEPEYHEDRLADYMERYNDLWVPKFGQRAAVVVYVWHVLRQSRLIDWLIRTFA